MLITFIPGAQNVFAILRFNLENLLVQHLHCAETIGMIKKYLCDKSILSSLIITYRWSIDLIIMEYWLLSSREIFMDLHLGIFFDKSGYINTAYHFPSMRSIIRSPTAVKFRGQGPLPTSNARVCGTIKIAAKLKINSYRLSVNGTQKNWNSHAECRNHISSAWLVRKCIFKWLKSFKIQKPNECSAIRCGYNRLNHVNTF